MTKAKTKKRGKAPATPAPKAEKQQKGTTKVAQVIALCQKGCTLQQIVETLGVSKPAASSLIGDARRAGKNVKFADGRYRI